MKLKVMYILSDINWYLKWWFTAYKLNETKLNHPFIIRPPRSAVLFSLSFSFFFFVHGELHRKHPFQFTTHPPHF